MKKLVYQLYLITVFYLGLTFLISCFFGIQNFHHGKGIGYPIIYYQLNVDGDIQHGVTEFINIIINILIIFLILILYRGIIKIIKINKKL